ncbi:MAG: glycosyltransferase family 4 protein [Deltaproteobacteria bacterium]|nr:glycosyltransferase family 4 protein [Deltaproteobacteria bacterium]
MVAPLYHLSLGGLGRQAQLLSERIADKGGKVLVITRKMYGVPVAHYSQKVKIIRIWTPWPRLSALEEIGFKNILIALIFSMGCAYALFRNRKAYDVAHFHGARAALFFNIFFLKLLGKKVIAKVSAANHALEAGSLKNSFWPIGNILMRLIKSVDIFIAISDEIYQGLLRDGIEYKRIIRIPNFIDVVNFRKADISQNGQLKDTYGLKDKVIVTYCGRLVRRKGVEFLLSAWQEVVKKRNDAVLLIIGDGPMRPVLESMAGELQIKDSAFFLGWQDTVSNFLGITDLFVQPSLQEGLANSLLEAMAFGLPIVATKIGGSEDVLQNGVNGLLVEPGDSAGLASAVLELMNNKNKASSLGEMALDTIQKKYRIDAVSSRYYEIYNQLGGSQQ